MTFLHPPGQPPANLPPRDRWGRPLIIPPDGGDPVAYTRASTLGSCLGDKTTLTKWKKRQVALGLARRPDLLTAVSAKHTDDGALNALCDQAMDAAGASAAATMGTALHQLVEVINLGGKPSDHVPPAALERLRLYWKAMRRAKLRPVLVETFVVNDHLRAAGTFDCLVETPSGETLIADLKTGSSLTDRHSALYPDRAVEMAVQLAVYAGGSRYDPATGARSPLHPRLDPTRGVIVWLPATGGPCRLIQLDLVEGGRLAELAARVHAARRTKQLAQTRLTIEET